MARQTEIGDSHLNDFVLSRDEVDCRQVAVPNFTLDAQVGRPPNTSAAVEIVATGRNPSIAARWT